jgi:hypothetical protein
MVPSQEENDPRSNPVDHAKFRTLRHDIYNQLSNIYLSVEQLRYEIPEDVADCSFYLESILSSSKKINTLLKETDL